MLLESGLPVAGCSAGLQGCRGVEDCRIGVDCWLAWLATQAGYALESGAGWPGSRPPTSIHQRPSFLILRFARDRDREDSHHTDAWLGWANSTLCNGAHRPLADPSVDPVAQQWPHKLTRRRRVIMSSTWQHTSTLRAPKPRHASLALLALDCDACRLGRLVRVGQRRAGHASGQLPMPGPPRAPAFASPRHAGWPGHTRARRAHKRGSGTKLDLLCLGQTCHLPWHHH